MKRVLERKKYEWKDMEAVLLKLEIAEAMIEDSLDSEYREQIHDAGLCGKRPSHCTVCYTNSMEE